jgi:hypothetical protein
VLDRQVTLKITDDASNQDTVVADYTKLITQDKVDLLLGTFSSLLNYPASAVAEKNQMVFVEPAGGAPDMFPRLRLFSPSPRPLPTRRRAGQLDVAPAAIVQDALSDPDDLFTSAWSSEHAET